MHGDFSRLEPIAENTYAVLWQEGRVSTDRDYNESELNHRRVGNLTRRDVIGRCGAPEGEQGGFAVSPNDAGDNLQIGAGRFYIDGILCENPAPVLFTEQPGLPGATLPAEEGFYRAILVVWQRHVTARDDPSIREVALGGPDTTTRLRTVCQVRLEPIVVGRDDPPPSCEQFDPAVHDVEPAVLRVRSVPTPEQEEPCVVPALAGYRGTENQLYRLEIHAGSDDEGGPTFLWSRDNGSVVSSLLAIDGTRLTVGDPGRDPALSFAPGQTIEITDEPRVLEGRPGVLATLQSVEGDVLIVTEWSAGGPPELGPGALVRRWDSPGAAPIADQEAWIALEAGVEVQLSGDFHSGDYWTFAARTITGDVEWPRDADGEPRAMPRQGIERHFCALAILRLQDGQWEQLSDCRPLFFPLADRPGLRVTGVELMNGAPLRNDADVGVENFARGVRIELSGPVDPATVVPATVMLKLDLPFPASTVERAFWQSPNAGLILGFQTITLDASVQADGASITWRPTANVGEWLRTRLFAVLGEVGFDQRLRCELEIIGGFITGLDDPQLFLDGDAFVRREADSSRLDIRLPSGDGRRGGDFMLWFRLGRGETPDFTLRVNLNTASHESLIALPRIGPTLARRIIEARQEQPFATLSELVERVPGFSLSLLEELRDRLTV